MIGDDYNKLRKTISIIIVDSEISRFKEMEENKDINAGIINYCQYYFIN